MNYQIKRGSSIIYDVELIGQREEGMMGIDKLECSFTDTNYVNFLKGDTVTVAGEVFVLDKPSDFERDGRWTYSLSFLSEKYRLANIDMLSPDDANALNEYDSYFTGTAEAAVDFVILNANRVFPTWVKGTIDPSDTKDFDFTGDNCLSALAKIADAYGIELWFIGKTIHLTKKGNNSGLSFRYGKGNGLVKLGRKVADSKLVTRLRVYGGKQNLPATYPGLSKRLRMPGGQLYIEDAAKVAKYGVLEGTFIDDDIFPSHVFEITSIGDAFTFSDSTIGFDINTHLFDNVSAKVKFITGQLSGWQFEIKKDGYNHSTRTIVVNPNEDEKSIEVPSNTGLKPSVGDKFILIDVMMPVADILDAEQKLFDRGTAVYQENCDPKVVFETVTDKIYLKQNSISVNLGDYVNIIDTDAGINDDIRITSKKTNLQDPFDLTLELSTASSISPLVSQIIQNSNNAKAITNAKLKDIARMRQMWRTTAELTTMLSTLRAELLLIMVDGANYETDIIAEVDPTTFSTGAGTLQHFEYIANGGNWNIATFSAAIPTNGAYYVYIRAKRADHSATIILSAAKIAVDGDPIYYYFPFGIISSLDNGQRMFSSTKGYTRITGNNIFTGKILSNTGTSFIDLDNDAFSFGDASSGIDYNISAPNSLTLRGEIIATNATLINLFVKNLKTKATGKRIEISELDNNISVYDGDNKRIMLIDDDQAVDEGRFEVPFDFYDENGNPRWISSRFIGPQQYYTYSNMGPGLRVGYGLNDSAGYSTVGRKRIFTTGKFSTLSGGDIKDGITKVCDFGGGKTLTIANGIIVEQTGF
ncbi:MAG: phage tail protein [Pedobacter sp.]